MSSVGKVHLNGSTVLSLNDRFTIMQKQGGGAPAPARQRARSRSRSRTRLVPHISAAVPISPRTTFRNRNLLQQLDQKHKLRVALKLKRKSMKIKPQNVIGLRGRRRLIRPTAATSLNLNNARRQMCRSNSVVKQIATVRQNVNRSQSRPRNNIPRQIGNQKQQRQQTRQQQRGSNRPKNQQLRGGKQTRGRPQPKTGKNQPLKSKEQLDAELDQYMVNTKSSLDQEMSIYTK